MELVQFVMVAAEPQCRSVWSDTRMLSLAMTRTQTPYPAPIAVDSICSDRQKVKSVSTGMVCLAPTDMILRLWVGV